MKVLLLNGSANKNGNTFTALSEIAKQLKKNGVESEIMQLGNKPVRGCIACGSGCYLPSWWCYGCIPDDEHDIRDDEHACGYFAILEHRLRLGTR